MLDRDIGRQFYAAEDGNGGASGDDNTGDAPGAESQDSGVTFTPEQQTHIDKVIADRLRRDRERQAKTDAEGRKKADDEAEAARLVKQQEWEKLAGDRETKIESLQSQLDETTAKLRQLDLRSKFMAQAETQSLKFANAQAANDAFALADLSEVDMDGDDAAKAIGAVIKSLSADRPYLFAQDKHYDINTDRGRGSGAPADTSDAKKAEIKSRYRI